MSTQELLELHAAGILGDMAYDVLEAELAGRGVTVPSRRKEEKSSAKVEGKPNNQFMQKYLVFTVSLFLAGVAEFLIESLFVIMMRIPSIQ